MGFGQRWSRYQGVGGQRRGNGHRARIEFPFRPAQQYAGIRSRMLPVTRHPAATILAESHDAHYD
jgi:hypothetical protein